MVKRKSIFINLKSHELRILEFEMLWELRGPASLKRDTYCDLQRINQ